MPINSGLMSSNNQECETPQDFFDALDAEFGFTLDAAASSANAKCKQFYTCKDDALAQDWSGVVWCNPPYGRQIAKFISKAWEEAQKGSVVVMLIPARTDTSYWHRWVMQAKEIRLVRGRLKFGNSGTNSAPFPSAVIIFQRGSFKPIVSSIEAHPKIATQSNDA